VSAKSATFFIGLQAAFAVLLSRLSNESDIVIGTPVANREQAQITNLIGFFVNTLVLRSDVAAGLSFNQLVSQSSDTIQAAFAHQQIPFEQIVERLQPLRSLSHSPLFQVVLVLENALEPTNVIPGLSLSQLETDTVVAKYDLSLNVTRTTQGMTLNWVYNAALFSADTISQMARRFERLLPMLLAAPDQSVHQFALLSDSEQQRVFELANVAALDAKPAALVEGFVGIAQLFEQQAQIRPDAVALVFDQQQLSYDQLNRQANRLAHRLITERGVTPDTLVGICVERSLDTVVSILAVLKEGGAYVPLDPDYPAARLAYILQDAKLDTVLIQADLLSRTGVTAEQALIIDEEIDQEREEQSDANPNISALRPDHLAYVIYTSGSTGQPKGVTVSHQNVSRLLSSTQADFGFDHNDVWTLFHSFAFDFSVWELWGALAHGGRLVVVPYWVSRSVSDFYALVATQQVTVLNQTPSAFSAFIGQDMAVSSKPSKALALRYVIFGGEALNLASLQPWIAKHGDQQIQLINMYGITETTVHVTYQPITAASILAAKGASIIGRPLADLAVLIVNDEQALLPPGVAGEMLVGGAGVTRGYLNQPQLTDSRFIALPGFEQKFYRTGDIGRYLSNGELAYLGRIDHQVKIRGFRIELGEVQHALMQVAGVQDAFVLCVVKSGENTADELAIVAYVVASESLDSHQIRQALTQLLPTYMVPAALVLLAALPLTANGKVDVNALPAADASAAKRQYIAPTTTTETLLCEIWQTVLKLDQVGIDDNFFALGGHSLLVIQVISQLQAQGLTMTARDLFATESLAELAASIDASDGQIYTAPSNLIPENCQQISPEMLPLVELSTAQIELLVGQVSTGVDNIKDIYPLGPLQQGILFHHIASDAGDPYVMPSWFKLDGKNQVETFIAALNFVIERHDVLRTGIFWQGLPTPVQVVLRQAQLAVSWSQLPEGVDIDTHMAQLSDAKCQRMDLQQGPLLKLTVVAKPNEDDNQYHLMLQLHHIIADHITQEIIGEEIGLYFQGQTEQLSQPVPYRDFIAHTLHQASLHDAKAYFTEQLGDITEPTAPFGLLDVQGDGGQISQQLLPLPTVLARAIRQLALNLNTSPATLFHAAWAVVISACSSVDDVVFGTVMSGRLQGTEGAANMPGVFINTLPIRVKLNNTTIKTLIAQVKLSLQQLLPYEQASLALAQGCSQLDAGMPLFTAMLNFRHGSAPTPTEDHQPKHFEHLGAQERTNYPLLLSVNDLQQGFELDVQVQAQPQTNASRITDYMITVLAQMVDSIEATTSSLSVLPATELVLLQSWNQTSTAFADDVCIATLFEAQVNAQPQATALMFEGDSLSYETLNRRANQLANYLIAEHGVKPDSLVGICLPRSIDMVVAILAVLKAGGAYVPLDPDYPQARLDYMLADSGVSAVLSRETMPDVSQLDCANIVVKGLTSRHLAYVIYTSGSTGLPKGVMVEHQALVNRIAWMQRQYGCDSSDRILQKTPFSFDVSVWEFIWPLSAGATLVLAKPGGHQQPDYLTTLIQQAGISKLHFVPSMLSSMLSLGDLAACDSLRQVFSSGEALAVSHVEQFNQQCPQAVLHNLYGPTEAAIDVSYWDCSGGSSNSQSIPIGRPIDNIQLQVLDTHGALVPIGAAGELFIGGVGLARGYLNQAELTAERFITIAGKRCYKTGDLVRWQADGNLAYLGRLDHQVKIRGFRIELGEIEAALMSLAGVSEAAVLASTFTGTSRLVAYVVTTQNTTVLRQKLALKLPQHMVPSAFVLLDKMPLTANGKLDRKALGQQNIAVQQQAFVAPSTTPRTVTEKVLAQVWQQVLGLEQVGIEDNFFAIGGHSLLVIQVIADLQQQGINMRVAQLFAHPTLGALAAELETQQAQLHYQAPANLIPSDCQHITPAMLPLIDLSEAQLAVIVEQVPMGASNIEDIYPLGPLQQGILFHHMVSAQTDPYVLTSLYRLKGRDTLDLFLEALQFVLDRHDVLRTAILWQDLPQAVQVVHREKTLPVCWLTVPAGEDCQVYMQALCDSKQQQMDLSQGSMLRLSVAKAPDSEQHFVLIQLHHIIADHVALEVIQQEIVAYHRSESQILKPKLERPVPYREFIAHTLHQAKHNDAQAYFSATLGDVDTTTAAFGLLDAKGDGSQIKEYRQRISDSTADQLRTLSRQLSISPAVFFHAAWAMVLGAASGRDDVVFGTVLSGRLQGTRGATTMLGVFINTLPVRVKLANVDAQTLLQQVKQSLHQLLPYEQTSLVVAQQCTNLAAEMPLFSALLNFRHSTNDSTTEPEPDPEAIFDYLGGQERSNYPLGLLVDDFDSGFLLNVQIDQSVDGQRIAEYMSEALVQLTQAIEQQSVTPVSQYSLLPASEQHQLVQQYNDTDRDYPRQLCLHQLFEAQVLQQPEAVALACGQQTLTFDALNQQANHLARVLANDHQVGPDTLVGICVERSLAMVVSILAIAKAGGAYVPLDPSYPAARLSYMIEDAQLQTVITTGQVMKSALVQTEQQAEQALCLDDPQVIEQLQHYQQRYQGQNLDNKVSVTNLAYVIYTSGTTGKPKGVMIEHHSVVNLAGNIEQMDLMAGGKKWGWSASLSFDASVKGLTQLLMGYPLRIITEDSKKDPLLLLPELADLAVIDCTPMIVD
jgi:amino acid adenylation domain-containing protein